MSDILFETRGAAGLITLNRPRALNALTHAMVVAMKAQLDAWAADSEIACVVIRGAGERAFCAGGDIRAIAESGRAGTPYALDFWRDEYILNAAIKHYPKPYMALMHGIAMGGGLGVSAHGNFRVVDDTALAAMPETGIGFFPDVGGSYFLSRSPGEIGMYLALTGARLKTADALYAGIATHLVRAEIWPLLIDGLAQGENPAELLSEIETWPAPEAPLAEQRVAIDNLFGLPSVEEILEGLDEEGDEWAASTAAAIRTKSPTSLKIAFREVREGKTLIFDDCMRMEFRIASRILAGCDFFEGVRAAIVDKDGAPKWRPASLGAVTDDAVASYFAPLGEKELPL
ncbi:MAG: enoyl-CoA hydratase/isomerase family protein [Rhizomicrobium sp.]